MALGWIVTVVGVVLLDWAPRPDVIRNTGFYVAEVLAAIIAPWLPFYLWRAYLINKSIERFERHKASDDTDEFILST
jgi:hypothetical protein